MELKEIRTLIELMKKNGLAVFKMEREGFKITLKTSDADTVTQVITNAVPAAAIPLTPAPAASAETAPAKAQDLREIKSPMVGTFYAASSPEAPDFAVVGQEVNADTVVCIVEAMKVMNEIKAETSGVIAEVCAESGRPVQFGQALFRLK